jgi:prepilin-type N-terminal cleavage/methylation domain-containing protein
MNRNVRSKAGFTLIELMIVVAILGILATVGIVAYRAYVVRARNAEATSVLADVRLKQEAYRATFHRYANIPVWVPDSSPGESSRVFASPTMTYDLTTDVGKWQQLGAVPGGQVYFSYYVIAGAPGSTTTGIFGSIPLGNNVDFWFAARALQDLNKDGKCEGFEVYSGAANIVTLSKEYGYAETCP